MCFTVSGALGDARVYGKSHVSPERLCWHQDDDLHNLQKRHVFEYVLTFVQTHQYALRDPMHTWGG